MEQGSNFLEGQGNVLSMWTSTMSWDSVLEVEHHLIGDAGSRITASSQPVAGLLH
jgi:hypothetical protein